MDRHTLVFVFLCEAVADLHVAAECWRRTP